MADPRPHAELADRFRTFSDRYFHGSSPLYERLARGVAEHAALLEIAALSRPGQVEPLLLLAAVHSLVLDGAAHPLAAWFPSAGGRRSPEDDPVPALRDFSMENEARLREIVSTRRVQTNEVRRCSGLMPGLAVAADDGPVALVEVGASAGLNLRLDSYAYDYVDARGETVASWGPAGSSVRIRCDLSGPPPPIGPIAIASRVGIDLAPADVRDPSARSWLRALVWPEHRERAALLAAALDAAAADPPPVVAGDAVRCLPRVVARLPPTVPVCVTHSAALAHFTAERRARFVGLLLDLAREREVRWLALEPPEAQPPLGGVLPRSPGRWGAWLRLARLGPGRAPEQRMLAAAEPHGGWLAWSGAGS